MMRTLEKPKASRRGSHSHEGKSSARTWLEVMPHLHPKHGGLSVVVPDLSLHLAKRHHVRVHVANFAEEESEYGQAAFLEELQLSHWPASRMKWLAGGKLRARYQQEVASADGVHIHGLWEAATAVTAMTAWRFRKPYVISAHGMLEPWALGVHQHKKRVYAALLERRILRKAACLHALTLAEAEDYRRFGCRNPIAVIPNGISLPKSVNVAAFPERFPNLKGKRLVLFLGRIHPKKGLSLLLEAWANVASRFPEAVLVIAGPDNETYRSVLEQKVQAESVQTSVCFTGMLEPELKWSALVAAECFVLPSYSEGFSVAILEAMGLGLPVVVTEQCHVPEVRQTGAGWEIRPETQSLSTALGEMLGNTPEANAEVGQRGRRLVRDLFSWEIVSAQMAELYRWVQGGPRPESFALLEVSA